ncbi:CheR family methyltransferase [Jannaschia seohaensis]|uniref:CheR family methyltransferase n=1 Tax=Jannaschia seohaensis TaxID=475081 RepID=UPI0014737B27|nr:CheR family methyltransferase [Jannaschia seohaensis]
MHIDPGKLDFFRQRLGKRLAQNGKTSFRAYADLLESGAGTAERKIFIEALTTHTTSFFREQKHFDWLEATGWSELTAEGAGLAWPLRIWSAACSNGSELYSTLISLKEHDARATRHLRVEGIGTDLSQAILRAARQGVYTANEIKGLSEARRKQFVLRAKDGSDRYRIVPELRNLCRFDPINLTEMGNDGPSLADLILLRNVLIYFDPPTQKRVVAALCARLRPHGVLMTGHTETVSQLPTGMVQVASSIYRKES